MAASALQSLDPRVVSAEARQESRNREVHLPPIRTYRWWARRTRAVSAALLAAAQHHLRLCRPMTILDPFCGGGVIPFVALAAGHRILASDLDPWAVWGLQTALALPPPAAIHAERTHLQRRAAALLSAAYRTTTPAGEPAWIAHTLRVAVAPCSRCGEVAALFPLALVSLTRRRDQRAPPADAWLACAQGHLFGVPHLSRTHTCPVCTRPVDPEAHYQPRRQVSCGTCGHQEPLSVRARAEGWGWTPALVERIGQGGVRLPLDQPTPAEWLQAEGPRWRPRLALGHIPDEEEGRVLLRHGFRRWEDLYPARQRMVLEGLLSLAHGDEPVRAAILGTIEMAGLLSRWDRFYLKSIEAMAGHRFNFTTLPVEPHVWGLAASGRGTVRRRLLALQKAAEWLHALPSPRDATVIQADARCLPFAEASVDLILTDPPYHDDVRYSELSAPFRAWAGLDAAPLSGAAVGLEGDYEAALTPIFQECRRVLRPHGRLLLTYANRTPLAWVALLGALEAAGFRAAGFATLHSENERDGVKRDVRAHALDLVLDLVPIEHPDAHAGFRAPEVYGSAEESFLRLAGDAALHLGGGGWRTALRLALTESAFRA